MGLVRTIRRTTYNLGAKLKLLPDKAPFIWPANVNGMTQWQMGNFLNYVEDGFALNSIIYAAIMYKVRAITQAQVRAYTGDPSNPELLPPTHPLSRLAIRPNSYMSWMELQSLLEAYLNLSGNCYLLIDRRNSKDGIPSAVWPIRPDEMFIIPQTGGLSGYLYVPRTSSIREGVPILVEDVIHVKFPNPMDNFEGLGYGLSPMSPMARSGDVDNQVTKFLKLFFDRGAMPTGLLKYDIPLDRNLVGEIKSRWRDIYGGVDNWTDIGILDSGASYEKLTMSFNDMGFDALDERNESRMASPFGVPPILLGTRFGLKNATYSNYEEARKAFWEDTMIYEIRLFETEMQYHLVGEDGSYLRYDVSQVPALRLDAGPMVDAAYKLWSMGMPLNMALTTSGLHIPPVPDGDIAYIGAQVREVGTPVVGQPTTGKAKTKTPALNVKDLQTKVQQKLEAKKRQVREINKIMDDWEGTYKKGAKSAFQKDLEEFQAMCSDLVKKSLVAKASVDWKTLEEPYNAYLKADGATNWRDTFAPMIGGVVNDTGKFWEAELGTSFNLRSVLAEDWFKDYKLEFAQPVNDTTSGYVHDMLAQAQAEGWSNQTLQKNMQQVFTQWMDGDVDADTWDWLKARVPDYRAEAIARTETMHAANAGSQALFTDWNVKKKSGVAPMTDVSGIVILTPMDRS